MAGHVKCILLLVLSILISRHPYASDAWNQHVLIGRSRAVPSACGDPSEGLCTLLPARIPIGVGPNERERKRKGEETQRLSATAT